MSRRAYLFLEADRRVFRCQFTKDLTLIGSGADADIIVKDSSVLGHHAQISRSGDSFVLRRLDRSEVRIDGERIDGGHELSSGERIGIGDAEILFVREQAEAPTTVRLVVDRPSEPNIGFWTAKSTITIGRERGDIIIDDPLISRVHCIIENYCVGGQYLLDARSERGTVLNGVAIDTRYRIVDGDVIQIGGVKLVFNAGAPAMPGTINSGEAAARRLEAARASSINPDQARLQATGVRGNDLSREPVIPRNPYQRYPSQIPGGARNEPEAQPRRASVDLRSGVSTGIVDPAAVRSARERPRPPAPRPEPAPSGLRPEHAPAPSPETRSAAERASAEHQPQVLPTFKPRAGWGERPAGGRGFDDEVSTRISHLGDNLQKGEGLWYLPKDGHATTSPAPGKPIIRARGDQVPEPPPRPARESRDMEPPTPAPSPAAQRPLIRRPDAAGLRPMPARSGGDSPSGAMPAPEPVSRRANDVPYEPRPVPADRGGASSNSGSDRAGGSSHPGGPTPGPSDGKWGTPGARSDNRWYHPDQAPRQAPRRTGDPSYYLPEQRSPNQPSAEERDDQMKREFRRPKFGGRTQGFDPSDY